MQWFNRIKRMRVIDYRIIKVGDRYAIQRRFPFTWSRCLDLVSSDGYWWSTHSQHLGDCLDKDFRYVLLQYNLLKKIQPPGPTYEVITEDDFPEEMLRSGE